MAGFQRPLTVLAIKSEAGGVLVARPVTFPAPRKETNKQDTTPAGPPRAGDVAAQEWATLESEAGLPQAGYVLEADVSPIRPTAMNLVVSLINLRRYDGSNEPPFAASDPQQYHILVRAPSGTLLAVNERARKECVIEKNNRPHGISVGEGYGNGAVIPLAKRYDMTMPGEYTVLVGLHFPGSTNVVCVANKVTIKVAQPDR
jgi:hypothetical protein